MLATEAERIAAGASPRDLSEWTGWRDEARTENLDLIDFYERFLVGQCDGWTGALNLSAVQAAMEIDAVPKVDRPDMARRLILLHGIIRDCAPKKG